MLTAGLILSLNTQSSLENLRPMLAGHGSVFPGSAEGSWLPVAIEAEDDGGLRVIHQWLAALPGSTVAKVRAQTVPSAPATPNDGITWDKAPCRFCGTGCHVRVGVRNDRVVAIEGDQLAEVNKGLLCVKGYHVGLALYGKDRLTQPLLRRNGVLEPISWEEAIETISQKVMEAPDQFAIYGSGQWTIPEGYAANKFIKGGLSSNHIDPNARICMASAVTGFLSVYGVDEPAGCYDDLDKCDVLIMWGNNMAEMHPVLFSRVIDRRTRGEKVTLIDLGTRRTRTSEFSDHYLEFRPHSDLAIMNGIAHLLIKENGFDPKFVDRFCSFRQAPKDPDASPSAPLNGDVMVTSTSPENPTSRCPLSSSAVMRPSFSRFRPPPAVPIQTEPSRPWQTALTLSFVSPSRAV